HGDVAAAEAVADDHPADEEDRERRHDPDQRRHLRQMDLRLGRLLDRILLLAAVVLAHPASPAVFHIIRGSNSRTASIIRAIKRKSGVAPGPATMSSMPRKSTIGAAIAAMKGMIIGQRKRRWSTR